LAWPAAAQLPCTAQLVREGGVPCDCSFT